MKINIDITQSDIEHIKGCDAVYEVCDTWFLIMKQIIRQIENESNN